MKNLKNQSLEITKMIASLISEEQHLAAKLEEAENRFPASLASHALGEITDAELSEDRKTTKQIRVSLKEIPLTIMGLEARQAEMKDQLRIAQREQNRKDAEKLFNELKPEFDKRYSPEMEDKLRGLAVTMGRRNEVEPFLQEARERFQKTPLCDR